MYILQSTCVEIIELSAGATCCADQRKPDSRLELIGPNWSHYDAASRIDLAEIAERYQRVERSTGRIPNAISSGRAAAASSRAGRGRGVEARCLRAFSPLN
jgi:hypothetical protein